MHVAETDVLVIGGGIAGHRAALAAREKGRRTSMIYFGNGASPFIVAFNAPFGHADPRDNSEVYYEDMLRGGYYLSERGLARVLSMEIEAAVRELEEIGVSFVRKGERYAQRHLSGSTYPRSLYITEGTGQGILRPMAKRCQDSGVEVWQGWKVISLLQDGQEVVGALAVKPPDGEVLALRAGATVLAAGGIGRIYEDSSYPADVEAYSYALAYKAGAKLLDMEFVQFEPTVVVYPQACKGMEMPTAMLGDGAQLKNANGERFMLRYNPGYAEKRIEKARMALCIQREINEGRGLPDGTVLFDTTVVPRDLLETYSSHCRRLRAGGLEPTKEPPRVRPASHSSMGGVYIDANCWSGIQGLFVCGEAAGGVHGASRLAGNAGSEILVFGARAGRAAADRVAPLYRRKWVEIEASALESLRAAMDRRGEVKPEEIKKRLCRIMFQKAGIYRQEKDLCIALDELNQLQKEIASGLQTPELAGAVQALEADNMVLVGRMILLAARARTESRGSHQRLDFPNQDDEHWLRHITISREETGDLKIESTPIA